MPAAMLALIADNLKVLWPVVSLVAVDMVNNLAGLQPPAVGPFPNNSVQIIQLAIVPCPYVRIAAGSANSLAVCFPGLFGVNLADAMARTKSLLLGR